MDGAGVLRRREIAADDGAGLGLKRVVNGNVTRKLSFSPKETPDVTEVQSIEANNTAEAIATTAPDEGEVQPTPSTDAVLQPTEAPAATLLDSQKNWLRMELEARQEETPPPTPLKAEDELPPGANSASLVGSKDDESLPRPREHAATAGWLPHKVDLTGTLRLSRGAPLGGSKCVE